MMIRKLRGIKKARYLIQVYLESWMNRKVKETEGRELTYIETTGLFVAYPIWKIVNIYK